MRLSDVGAVVADTPYITPEYVRQNAGPDASALPPSTSDGDALIADRITEFEETTESYYGFPWTDRTLTLTRRPARCGRILQLVAPVQSVTSLTIDGTTIDAGLYTPDLNNGTLDYLSGFSTDQDVEVVYVAGYPTPQAFKRGCLIFVLRSFQVDNSGTSRDVLSQGFDGGTTRYATPNFAENRPFGFLEVDALVNTQLSKRRPGIA